MSTPMLVIKTDGEPTAFLHDIKETAEFLATQVPSAEDVHLIKTGQCPFYPYVLTCKDRPGGQTRTYRSVNPETYEMLARHLAPTYTIGYVVNYQTVSRTRGRNNGNPDAHRMENAKAKLNKYVDSIISATDTGSVPELSEKAFECIREIAKLACRPIQKGDDNA